MKKTPTGKRDPDLRDEYDFIKGYAGSTPTATLRARMWSCSPRDVAAVFPESESVNEALRALVQIAVKSGKNAGR